MSDQIKPSVTNPTIADVYQQIEEERLILRPDFQRKFVWTTDHQESFIETILQGLPFPEVYICSGDVDVKKLRTTKYVIDGQQRLTTIRNYIEGKHEKKLKKIERFEKLPEADQRSFLSYQMVIRDIGKVDDTTIKEIFRRINLTKFKLDDIEIHNAVYDGDFIQTAKDILNAIDLSEYGVFRESEFSRMGDLHFMLLVMATLENGGYFAQDKEVESKVSEFNDEYPSKNHIFSKLTRAFAVISELDLPKDSMWFRKGNFFTLVVEIAFNLDSVPKDFRSRLLDFEDKVMVNKKKPDSEYGKYYHHMYQATHGRTSRVGRAAYFKSYCLGLGSGL